MVSTTAIEQFVVGACVVRPQERLLIVDGAPAKLGARAFDVLMALFERRERVVTKNELLDLVWPGLVVEENNLQVHISALRKLLGPQAIATVPGRGYRFTAEVQGASVTSSPAPIATLANPTPTNLDRSKAILYGRDDEITALSAMVTSHPLTTLVGAGGIGKTRLACATASAVIGYFEHGVWLVELGPVSDPRLVPSAVAQALGVSLPGKASGQEELVRALGGRALLLILDNCEHVLSAASQLVHAIRSAAPRVHLLITSQESLKVEDEHLFRLAPLSVPSSDSLEAALAFGAVSLFVERVRALRPSFALNGQNVADVIEICRRLDGLPLAIELAAARVPLVGVAGVRERLNERFRVLTGGSRDAPRRHQTLRETLDWSHSMLTPDECTVLRRAGVFVGGFGLDLAQNVLTDSHMDAWSVLDHLGTLVDKSWVVADLSEPPRYRLLESMRAYALEKLADAGELELSETRKRHALGVLALFEATAAQNKNETRDQRLARHLPDIDNLREALDWLEAREERALHVALAGASAWIWVSAGQRAEGLPRCDLASRLIDASTPPAREARMHLMRSQLRVQSGVHEFTVTDLNSIERAVSLYRASNDRLRLCHALSIYSVILAIQGKLERCEQAALEVGQLLDASWPPSTRWFYLVAQNYFLYYAGRYDEGEAAAQACLRFAKTLDDRQLVGLALGYLERYSSARGDYAQAEERGRELTAKLRSDRFGLVGVAAFAFADYATALTKMEKFDEALLAMREAVANELNVGTLWELLGAIALLAFKRGRIREATMAFGRFELMVAQHPNTCFNASSLEIHKEVEHLLKRAKLKAEYEALRAQGKLMSDEEVAALALAD